jgi:hypothetical protein
MILIFLFVNCYILCIFWKIINTYLFNLMPKNIDLPLFLQVSVLAREPGRVGPIQRRARAEPVLAR